MLDSLFNKVTGLQATNFIKKVAPTQAFSCECCEFFRNNFFYVTTPVAAFMFTRKGRRRKRWTKELGKNFQLKEENENISFNFYLQVLVLAKTEMQTQLCKYYRTAHLFSYFFFKIFFLVISAYSFLCVSIFDKLKNTTCSIYQYIQKQTLRVVP